MNFFARKYWAALMPLLFGAILATAAPQAGRIALLQYVNGAVSIQPGGTGSWVAAAANRPLSISDNVWTDKASRAELNVGTGLMQLNSETSLTLVNVDRGTVQVQLHQGSLFLHVRHLFDGEIYEVNSSNGTFTMWSAADPGTFRVMEITEEQASAGGQHGRVILSGTAQNVHDDD